MATLRKYWRDVDKATEQALLNTINIAFIINMSKLYEGDDFYIQRIKSMYVDGVNDYMKMAIQYGKNFFESVISDLGNTPVKLSKRDLQLAYNRAMSITRGYINLAVNEFSAEVRIMANNMRVLDMKKEAIVGYFATEQRENRPLFSRFNNRMRKIIDDGVDRAAAFVYHEGMKRQYSKQQNILFTWIAVGDKRTCPDCRIRHKKSDLYNEWRVIGFPRTGFTFCLLSCRCILVPEQYVDDELDLSKPLVRKTFKIRGGKLNQD